MCCNIGNLYCKISFTELNKSYKTQCKVSIMSSLFIQPTEAQRLFDSGYLISFQIVYFEIGKGWYLRLLGKNCKDFYVCTFRERETYRIYSTADSAIKAAKDIGFRVNAIELAAI